MLSRGDSIGVFQLEGGPMRVLMRRLAPSSFDDVAALVALYRPGPMAANMHNHYADRKNGREPIFYEHPDLEPVLKDTYGLMIYQESVMRVAQKMAGYSARRGRQPAQGVRRRRSASSSAQEREKFVRGLPATGLRRGSSARGSSTSSSRSRTTPSTSRTPTATASSRTRPPGARCTTPSSTSPRCSPRCATTRTAPRCTSRSAARSASRSPSPTSTGRWRTSPRRSSDERVIVFGLAAVRNVGREPRRPHRRGARPRTGRSSRSTTSCGASTRSCSTSGRWSRSSKAARSTRFGVPRKGLYLVVEELVARTLERRREHDAGIATLFAAAAEEQGEGEGTWEGTELADPRPGVLEARAAPVRKGDARPLRLGPPAARRGRDARAGTPTTRSPRPRSSPSCPRATAAVVRWAGS